MYDDGNDPLTRAAATGAALVSRGLLLKLGALAAVLLVVALFLLAPAAKVNKASAACLPTIPGQGTDQPDDSVNQVTRAIQIAHTKVIDRVAVQIGLPGRATLVALMTALQESQLQNLPSGHLDSVGLFQQRPSAGWGTVEQIRDPVYATRAFFGGPQPPSPPGLTEIDGWYTMPLTEAAQAVQVSAYPEAYARHEDTARTIATAAGVDLNRPGDPSAGRPVPPGTAPTTGTGTSNLGPCGGLLPDTDPIHGKFPAEACSVIPDPSNGRGCVTPRTAAWISNARAAFPGQAITCWDPHSWNPSSDHPRGKACDLMTGRDARTNPTQKTKGDRVAAWTLAGANTTGVHYVIWYGRIWSARTGLWKPYNGGGIYNPGDANGGHYNHVHVSLY